MQANKSLTVYEKLVRYRESGCGDDNSEMGDGELVDGVFNPPMCGIEASKRL